MPSRRPQLSVRIVCADVPGIEHAQRQALVEIGRALADQLVDEARAEVAASLGVSPDAIARERGVLDEETRTYLEGAAMVRT